MTDVFPDWNWMQRALTLAEHGRGCVEPNPLVGAVVVHDGKVIGEGWHQSFGGPHAEVHALAAAGAAARGADLYVTLEPCCHQGKTPPCTDAILRAGVRRVVAAMSDPFPEVAGRGAERLRAAGVQVDIGLGDKQARRLNAPYWKLLTAGRPYVHAKWAMTLDGKIATRTGDSKWISNEASRRRVHQLRGRMDAILVGVGSALADDPLLTARPPGPRTAARIVLDSRGRLPGNSQLVQTAGTVPTWLVHGGALRDRLADFYRASSCEVFQAGEDGRPSVLALLQELGRRRMTNILVEGGSQLFGSFLDVRAIDEVHVFLAPQLLGGEKSRTPIGGMGVDKIAEALRLEGWQMEMIEGDIYVRGWCES